jgi:acyl carrier protein
MEKINYYLDKYPNLSKIKKSDFENSFTKVTGSNVIWNKTYCDQHTDELDLIEIIMDMEKNLEISIPDEFAIEFFDGKCYPTNLESLYKINLRNENIEKLGI